ncbi:MAG: FAD/NAD(P)-binding protein [Pseudomonadota bacterium]
MASRVTRRDFLNGVAVSAASLLIPRTAMARAVENALGTTSDYYPPTLTGLRGSHDGSYEVAHALAWNGQKPATYQSVDEHYDLVIVGAGMSGLAAAHYWRKARGEDAKILLLDNHDDFGGHAKRNEFHHGGRMVLNLGGAQNLENPQNYSVNAKALLADLGIDQDYFDEMAKNTPDNFFLGGQFKARTGMALPDGDGLKTVSGDWTRWLFGEDGYDEAIKQLPLTAEEQKNLIAFIGGERDFLDELSLRKAYEYCNTTSYEEFLREKADLNQRCIEILDNQLRIFMGFTAGSVTVTEAISLGMPGLNALGWLARFANSLIVDSALDSTQVRMFPDGNASIARLLVQRLIPEVAPKMRGKDDVAITRFNYAALDQKSNDTRIRLNSTAVSVRELMDRQVQVDYVRRGAAERVSADHCILACYNAIIPHLCPQMPDAQKKALAYQVKVPFIYASVLLNDGQAFSKLDATLIRCPGQMFQWVSAAPTISVGGYEPPRNAEDPMALFLMSAPTESPKGNETLKDLLRFARHTIYATSFQSYETSIRDQLQSLLGTHGFEHERGIAAITVNRISHGYAYEYMSLYDPDFPEGEAPHEIARSRFGRISVANSDSEARAYMDAAWDAAWRAVNEQAAISES